MAAMEKLTYPPLIEHLKSEAAFYNQLYADYEIQHRAVDKTVLQKWIVQVLEPIVASVTKEKPDAVPLVFKSFYTALLSLLGSGTALSHEEEYIAGWNLCKQIPHLVTSSPQKIIRSINAALQSVRTYQPLRTMDWIWMMHSSIPSCQTVEQFLHCGRITAWLCGLAHLKEAAAKGFQSLPTELQNNLQQACPSNQKLPDLFTASWPAETPQFVGEAGGFTGLNGTFISPPLLAESGEHIVAADSRGSFVLFADAFGNVLLPHPSDAVAISKNANRYSLTTFQNMYGNVPLPLDDISSCVLKATCFAFTLHSSHYIYLYGWHG